MAPLQPEYIEEITLPVPKDETMDYWIRLLETLEKGGRPEVDSSEMLRVMQIVEAGFFSSAEKKIIRTEV